MRTSHITKMMVMLTLTKEVDNMILDLINEHRATLNKDPEYNVQIKSAYPITHVQYKPGYGEDSFEIMHKDMIVKVKYHIGECVTFKCDRIIEEFDKLLLIKNFHEISEDLRSIESIVVK